MRRVEKSALGAREVAVADGRAARCKCGAGAVAWGAEGRPIADLMLRISEGRVYYGRCAPTEQAGAGRFAIVGTCINDRVGSRAGAEVDPGARTAAHGQRQV